MPYSVAVPIQFIEPLAVLHAIDVIGKLELFDIDSIPTNPDPLMSEAVF
jgi:hypothetical protein